MAEQVPADTALAGRSGYRYESCWLCGMSQATYQLVADGGDACTDVRWYCEDTRGCTERWVTSKAVLR